MLDAKVKMTNLNFSKRKLRVRCAHPELSSSRRYFLGRFGVSTLTGLALRGQLFGASLRNVFETSQLRGQGGLVRLDGNENPYGPSKKVVDAIVSALNGVNRYPETEPTELLEQIAEQHRVHSDQ